MFARFCICRGARLLVVPVLAGLMECDPQRMWTFERFFDATNNLLRKRVMHVFSLACGSILNVYVDPDQRLSHMQDLIAQQSDIPSKNQFLLYENVRFSEYIDRNETAHNFPTTTEANPVFLFPNSAEAVRLSPVPYRESTLATFY